MKSKLLTTKCQLYKIVDNVKNSETFVVVDQKALLIGNGFGGSV
ncbi:hypothetical protein [Paenibacillus lignilyticus]|nr:hypothetical protein [Paenibacillus lignilyticus]